MSNLKFQFNNQKNPHSLTPQTRARLTTRTTKHAAATRCVVDDDVVQTSPRADARTRDERERDGDGDD